MKVTCVVNAGGASSRMGVWAPMPKQFLPIGPWDPIEELGVGPCNTWRILHHFDRLSKEMYAIEFGLAIAIAPDNPAMREAAEEIAKPFNARVLTDPAPRWGPLGFLHACDFVGGVFMHNADDLLPYEVVREVMREAAGMTETNGVCNDVNVLAAAYCTQYGPYGELGAYINGKTGEQRYMVKEKPMLSQSLVGCGALYMTPISVQFAKLHPEIKNSSVLLNTLAEAEQGTELSVVGLDPEYWQTFNTPKEYYDACQNPRWKDAAWQAWKDYNDA